MGTAISTIDKQINKYVAQMNVKEKQAVLGIVRTIVEKQEDDPWEDKAFIAELDRRTAEYESGKAKVLTLDQLETRARKAYKAQRSKNRWIPIRNSLQGIQAEENDLR
jgi:putative addiction module component (TIGR02574 family)